MKSKIDQIYESLNQSWEDARHDGSYERFGNAGGDDLESWKLTLLRFGNQFPVVCYAFGISRDTFLQVFPEIFSVQYHYDNVRGKDWPTFENLVLKNFTGIQPEIIEEILDQSKWNWHNANKLELAYDQGYYNQYFPLFSINDQLDFISKNKTRTPNNVLDLGGGRGEIANVLKYLNLSCLSIEPGQYADLLYEYTGKHFFGDSFDSAKPQKIALSQLTNSVNLSQFDTIVLCETIEHLPELDFWNFWNRVKTDFHGLVIIANWIYFHPIPAMGAEHIFEINDQVYDKLVSESKNCVYRNGSHLILEI